MSDYSTGELLRQAELATPTNTEMDRLRRKVVEEQEAGRRAGDAIRKARKERDTAQDKLKKLLILAEELNTAIWPWCNKYTVAERIRQILNDI